MPVSRPRFATPSWPPCCDATTSSTDGTTHSLESTRNKEEPMQLGITVTNFSWPAPAAEMGPTVARLVGTADDAGFDSIWTMDHSFQISVIGLPPEEPM